jgi:hypothetical protein
MGNARPPAYRRATYLNTPPTGTTPIHQRSRLPRRDERARSRRHESAPLRRRTQQHIRNPRPSLPENSNSRLAPHATNEAPPRKTSLLVPRNTGRVFGRAGRFVAPAPGRRPTEAAVPASLPNTRRTGAGAEERGLCFPRFTGCSLSRASCWRRDRRRTTALVMLDASGRSQPTTRC